MITSRPLRREEIEDIWTIDRSEVINGVYYLEGGRLVLKPEHYDLSVAKAGEMGARQLYISATPSENTIYFYLSLGCRVTAEPDPELYSLEPEDIHLECDI